MAKKKTIEAQARNPAQSILKLLDKIDDLQRHDTFRLWISACSLMLKHEPALLFRATLTGSFANTEEETKEWNDAGLGRLSQSAYKIFAEAFAILRCAAITNEGQPTYKDTVGEIYMLTLEGSRWNQDQFYTPEPVCDMMAQMSMGDLEAEYQKRLENTPEGETVAPLTVMDPACGSGRLLLAFAKNAPRWLIDNGWIEFYGQDVNYLAVEMCKLNCRLYGLGGRRAASIQDTEREVRSEADKDGVAA